MTTATIDLRKHTSASARIRDALAITWRNLIAYRRIPALILFSTIQPVVFVLMFRYVFGGAIRDIPGVRYVDYLMPGIFVQTVTFGAIGTAIGLATDLQKGLIDRFRSLPMARSAVLAGRTLAELVRNVFVTLLMALVGFLVGFRVHGGIGRFLLALALVVLFGYALSWVFATVGLAVGDPETAQAASFPVMAPLVFASSAFVPIGTMPSWLRPFAEHQPVSATINAVRDLVLGRPATGDVLFALAWIVGILAVFAPLAVRLYRRA